MDKDEKHINEKLQEKVSDFRLPVEDSVWDAIEAGISDNPIPPASTNSKGDKKTKRIWWTFGALLLLILLSTVGYLTINIKQDKSSSNRGSSDLLALSGAPNQSSNFSYAQNASAQSMSTPPQTEFEVKRNLPIENGNNILENDSLVQVPKQENKSSKTENKEVQLAQENNASFENKTSFGELKNRNLSQESSTSTEIVNNQQSVEVKKLRDSEVMVGIENTTNSKDLSLESDNNMKDPSKSKVLVANQESQIVESPKVVSIDNQFDHTETNSSNISSVTNDESISTEIPVISASSLPIQIEKRELMVSTDSMSTLAYQELPKLSNLNKLRLMAYGGFGYSYRTLESDQNSELIKHKNDHETPATSYDLGLAVEYQFSNRLFARLGAGYKTYREDYDFQHDTIIHVTTNNYDYLQIPITLGYRFLDLPKGELYGIGAFSTSRLLNAQSSWVDPNSLNAVAHNNEGSDQPFENWTYALSLGVDYRYQLTPSLRLHAIPMVDGFLNSVYQSRTGLKQKPYSFLMHLGVSYQF